MPEGVRVEHLDKRYGVVRALDDVSVVIEPGELFFLLGPSGCGKTTLLRCLAGFGEPDRGRIIVGEQDVTHRAAHRRDMGMVFQNYALWPHMTVRENVAFGLKTRAVERREAARLVEEVLRLVRMETRAERSPNALSGGQQQRVALARALVVRPRCLLLDEPLSNLDAKLRLEMRVEIRRICKDAGVTTIYVTHDQKEALSMADRLAVMDQGAICQVGTPLEVYRRPNSLFVATFIGETNLFQGRITSVGAAGVEAATPSGTFRAPTSPAGLKTGAEVWVSVRPEALAFAPAPEASGVNRLRGEIIRMVYQGEIAQYTVRLAGDGGELHLFELNPHGGRGRIGETVSVRAADEDVVLLAH